MYFPFLLHLLLLGAARPAVPVAVAARPAALSLALLQLLAGPAVPAAAQPTQPVTFLRVGGTAASYSLNGGRNFSSVPLPAAGSGASTRDTL